MHLNQIHYTRFLLCFSAHDQVRNKLHIVEIVNQQYLNTDWEIGTCPGILFSITRPLKAINLSSFPHFGMKDPKNVRSVGLTMVSGSDKTKLSFYIIFLFYIMSLLSPYNNK